MVRVLLIEAESNDTVLQEIMMLLSKKENVRSLTLPSSPPVIEALTGAEHTLIFPTLEIQMKEQCVYRKGELIPMSYYEFSVLSFLAEHPKWVFTKEQIYEAVWNEAGVNCEATISNIVSRIRKKLNPEGPKESYIKTVVNGGYKFDP